MKVRELMHTRVVTVGRSDELALAAQLMAWNGLRHLPVLSEGTLVGVLSDRDLLAHREDNAKVLGRVEEAMSSEPDTIGPQADLEEASAKLAVNKHGCLPVVEKGRLLGMLTTTDLLAEMSQMHLAPPSGGGMLDRDVESVMTSKVAAVFEDDGLMEAAVRMHQYGIRHLPVIDGMHRVVGILSERDVLSAVGDLRRALEEPSAFVGSMTVREAMTADPRTVLPSTPLAEVIAILAQERYGALPVVDEGETLVGMISYVDVLRGLRQVA